MLYKKSNYIDFKSHKHKEKYSVVVKEYDFIEPNINRIDYTINNCARDCYDKYSHTFNFFS